MIDLEEIFRNKKPNEKKLQEFGFIKENELYKWSNPIFDGEYRFEISIGEDMCITYRVVDSDTEEEYRLLKVRGATGSFLGEVRSLSKDILMKISAECFDDICDQGRQRRLIFEHVYKTYGVSPEYMWKNHPTDSILRSDVSNKWFGVIMTIERNKLGLDGSGKIEIILLKDRTENIKDRIDSKKYFAGYHMNKKYWYSVGLDLGVDDDVLLELVDISYGQVTKL